MKKVAVITGASSGLGRGLTHEFFKLGYDLALIDIDINGLDSFRKELVKENRIVTIHRVDISNEKDIEIVRNEIVNEHQQIDVLVNNAGISISKPFEEVQLENFKRLFEVNFWGTVHCCLHFLPLLRKSKNARLVNVVSDFALMGFPGKSTYGSSKSAIMGFTYAIKTELADTHVRVCLIIPPPLDTNLVNNSIHMNEAKRIKEADFLKKNGMPIDKACRKIVRNIEKGKFRIVVGPLMFWIDIFSRTCPTLVHYLIGRFKNRIDFV